MSLSEPKPVTQDAGPVLRQGFRYPVRGGCRDWLPWRHPIAATPDPPFPVFFLPYINRYNLVQFVDRHPDSIAITRKYKHLQGYLPLEQQEQFRNTDYWTRPW